MFASSNCSQPTFGGIVFGNGGHVANIELDGSGRYEGQRKMLRFRLVKGDVSVTDNLKMKLNNMTRSVRIAAFPDESNFGYVELL